MLVAVIVLAAALVAAPRLVGWAIDLRRPALARHLPAREDQAEKEFNRRIKARFPLGSSAAAMEQALFDEGFGAAHAFKSSRYVRLDRSTGLLLEESFVMLWEADGDKLSIVRGTYYLTGL